MSAELSARITAAAAVLADFRAAEARSHVPGNHPAYAAWALRLSSELGSVLARLDEEAAGSAPDTRRYLEQLIVNAVERAYQDGLAVAPATAPRTYPYAAEILAAVGRVLDGQQGGTR